MKNVPLKNSDIIWRTVGGEVVLLNPQSGQYFGLNAVGSSLWEKMDDKLSLADLTDLLLLEYDVERDVLDADIRQLVAALEANGLLSLK